MQCTMVNIQWNISNVSRYRNDVSLPLQRPCFTIDGPSSTNYYCTRPNWPRDSPGTPTVAIVWPLPHERRSSVSTYVRLRPDGRDTAHCTPVAKPSHSTALGAEQRYVLLTTYIAEAAIFDIPSAQDDDQGYCQATFMVIMSHEFSWLRIA